MFVEHLYKKYRTRVQECWRFITLSHVTASDMVYTFVNQYLSCPKTTLDNGTLGQHYFSTLAALSAQKLQYS